MSIYISLCISCLLVWGESKVISSFYIVLSINHGINSSQLLEIVTFSINTRMTRNPRLFFTPCHKYSYLKYSGMNRILETGNNHRDVDVFGTSRVKIKKHFMSIFMTTWTKLNYSLFEIFFFFFMILMREGDTPKRCNP